MITLTEAQDLAVNKSISGIAEYGSFLNASKTGTGKTCMAVQTALRMKCPVAVIAPKACLPHWRKEFGEAGIVPIFVLNYEKIRRGNNQYLDKIGKRVFRWKLPPDTLLIFDEVQRCKSPYTQNALLLISAAMQKVNTLLLSATSAEDCTEMRAIGYALQLHSLNRSTALKRGWVEWMKQHGCSMDGFGSWRSGPKSKLKELHEILYKYRAARITEADMPQAFRENHIIEESVEFAALPAIKRFYREAGITPAIVDAFIEKELFKLEDPKAAAEADKKENIMVAMLRARQMSEACKIPEIVEMTTDLLEEGFSIAVFLNFRESVEAFKHNIEAQLKIPVSVVIGGQTADERSENVKEFSDDRRRVIVLTQAAGGTGLDGLQDLHGNFPRVSLISPSFSAQEMRQTLGRLPRAFAKSGVIQKVLIASGTIEDNVMRAIRRKLANLDALHGK